MGSNIEKDTDRQTTDLLGPFVANLLFALDPGLERRRKH